MQAAIALAALISQPAPEAGASKSAHAIQVAFCPSQLLRVYPLAAGSRFQSLVVPSVAVLNKAKTAARIDEVDLELLNGGAAVDTRVLKDASLEAVAKSGAGLQASGALDAFAFQFCDGKLLGRSPHLAGGAAVAAGGALLISNQVFAWKGVRDGVRVRVKSVVAGERREVSATIPITAATVKTPMRFPLDGRWFVAVAGTPHGGHRWALPEAFALDIVALGAGDASYQGDGAKFTDYYAYGAPILAAGTGTVVKIVEGEAEDPAILRRPGESLAAYGERIGQLQNKLLARGEAGIAGNSVLIDHGNGEYSLYAHLKTGSIKVKPGQAVAAGAPIARLGASGNTTEPHLHFQVCDQPSALHCAGIPLAFTNVELPYADGPRAIQAGDIVLTN